MATTPTPKPKRRYEDLTPEEKKERARRFTWEPEDMCGSSQASRPKFRLTPTTSTRTSSWRRSTSKTPKTSVRRKSPVDRELAYWLKAFDPDQPPNDGERLAGAGGSPMAAMRCYRRR